MVINYLKIINIWHKNTANTIVAQECRLKKIEAGTKKRET
jgi:hypothetical protein